jgi:hypothetical protein
MSQRRMRTNGRAAMGDVKLDGTPQKDHIWAAAEVHAEELAVDVRPPHPQRELWYVPTATVWDAHRAEKLFREYGIQRVCDLGAGDCRFGLWLDRRGYDVVAYELNEAIAAAVADRFHLGNMELRVRDYYADYDELSASDTAVVAFGGTNELPTIPSAGLAIQGYAETGVTVWYSGEEVARW